MGVEFQAAPRQIGVAAIGAAAVLGCAGRSARGAGAGADIAVVAVKDEPPELADCPAVTLTPAEYDMGGRKVGAWNIGVTPTAEAATAGAATGATESESAAFDALPGLSFASPVGARTTVTAKRGSMRG